MAGKITKVFQHNHFFIFQTRKPFLGSRWNMLWKKS